MLLSGTVFINRGNNKSAVASMTQAGKDMMRKRVGLALHLMEITADHHSDITVHLSRGNAESGA